MPEISEQEEELHRRWMDIVLKMTEQEGLDPVTVVETMMTTGLAVDVRLHGDFAVSKRLASLAGSLHARGLIKENGNGTVN